MSGESIKIDLLLHRMKTSNDHLIGNLRFFFKKNIWRNMKYIFYIIFIILTILTMKNQSLAKTDNLYIDDISKKWNFISIGDYKNGDLFSNGKYQFLCVESGLDQYSLWNPLVGFLSAPTHKVCSIPVDAYPVDSSIQSEDLSTFSENSIKNVNLSKNPTIISIIDDKILENCGSILGEYFEYIDSHGKISSFYIFLRRRTPQIFEKPAECDFEMGKDIDVKIGFDTPTLSHSNLQDGRILIYYSDINVEYVKEPLLIIDQAPKSVWSSDGNIFIVPRDIMKPALDKAGLDPRKRYAALLKILDQPQNK